MQRRLFLGSALLSPLLFRASLRAADNSSGAPQRGHRVAVGRDRADQPMRLNGLTPTDTKVSTADSNGGIYLFEHRNMPAGGPPRHFHYEQDEWFYAIDGEFVFEVGEEKFLLAPGDTIFLPRMVPHVWAHVGEKPGTILGAVTPAGTFETFFREVAMRSTPPAPEEAERHFAAHGMKIVGPPLPID
jgi:mannose-6-phosphate isomerase-like protein (cupin superfamily)